LRRHTGRRGERRSLGETDCIRLLDGAHQLLKAPLIVVWDRLSTHLSKTMKALVAERDWLTVVLLPGYAPDLNPVEGLWAHIKRSLANLAARTLSELETLLRRRLKALQYRHGILGGFLAGTQAHGFEADLWTLERVGVVVERVTGVKLARASVWRLLTGRLGWSLQRPRRQAVERDEAETARWVAQEWPRIKRGR
jgi:transposase